MTKYRKELITKERILQLMRQVDCRFHSPELYQQYINGTYKAYAGIGSRSIDPKAKNYKQRPNEDLWRNLMYDAGEELGRLGFTVRSGRALGPDSYFEKGADRQGHNKEIFVSPLEKYKIDCIKAYHEDLWAIATEIASGVHEAWDYMDDWARSLHTRNCFQILGPNLNMPAKFVLCWTEGEEITATDCSKKTGGTGTAIKIASILGVPVFNLSREEHCRRVMKMIGVDAQLEKVKKPKDHQMGLGF